jgi:cell division protein FtsL
VRIRNWVRGLRDFMAPSHAAVAATEQRSRLTLNEQLIREQDRERNHELLRISMLGIVVLVPLLLYVWLQVAFMETAYKVEELQSEQARLGTLLRSAQLERASLETPERVERLARQRLAMEQPAPEAIIAVKIEEEKESGGKDGPRGEGPSEP